MIRNEKELIYAMHEHSVSQIIGYVMRYFENSGKPVPPWSVYLNFNKNHKRIKLGPEHFSPDGKNISQMLINQIESIDPGWKVRGSEPVFEEVATRKRLKIGSRELGRIDLQKKLDDLNKPKEVTFFSVMRQVFGKH